MDIKTYKGLLCQHDYGEAHDILFLSTIAKPLAEQLEWDIADKIVTARYWITEEKATKEEAQENFIRELYGDTQCKFHAEYSETSGYLWTDEECRIGGHDLMNELWGHIGKWLILEIQVH